MTATAPDAALRSVARIEVSVAPPQSLGLLKGVERRLISILGGAMTIIGAPALSGTILPGGSDLQQVRLDGTIELTARYAVDFGEAGCVLIENIGLRRAGASPESAYFRGVARFEAPAGPLQWLNDSVFITSGRREGATVLLDVFEVT